MGNQEKAAKGDTVLATSTRLFQGRVVEDTEEKRELPLAEQPIEDVINNGLSEKDTLRDTVRTPIIGSKEIWTILEMLQIHLGLSMEKIIQFTTMHGVLIIQDTYQEAIQKMQNIGMEIITLVEYRFDNTAMDSKITTLNTLQIQKDYDLIWWVHSALFKISNDLNIEMMKVLNAAMAHSLLTWDALPAEREGELLEIIEYLKMAVRPFQQIKGEVHPRDLIPPLNKKSYPPTFILISETERSEPNFEVIGLIEHVKDTDEALRKFILTEGVPESTVGLIGVIPWSNIDWIWLNDLDYLGD